MASLSLEHSKSKLICEDGEQLTLGEVVGEGDQLRDIPLGRSVVLGLMANTRGGLFGYLHFRAVDAVLIMGSAGMTRSQVYEILSAYQPEFVWCPISRLDITANLKRIWQYHDYVLCECSYRSLSRGAVHKDLSLLVSTSGSTGSAKFVRQSHKNISSNTASILTFLKLQQADVAITSLPLHYTFGMSVVNCVLAAGGSIVINDTSIVQGKFWNAVKKRNVSIFAGVPVTYETLEKMKFFERSGHVFRILLQAGGKLNEALQVKVAAYCDKNDARCFLMYGQTEATARMAYLDPADLSRKLGSVGHAISDGEIALLGRDGRPIQSARVIGELHYRGPNVCMGYAHGREDLSKGDEWGGSLATGDLAERDDEGFLYIRGRTNRVCKSLGLRVNLDELEQIIKTALNNLHDVACISKNDRIHIFVRGEISASDVASVVTSNTEVSPAGIHTHNVSQFPHTESGKVDYQMLEELLL